MAASQQTRYMSKSVTFDGVYTQYKTGYSAYIVSGGTKYNVTAAIISVERSDADNQIAQRVTLRLMNVQANNGTWLTGIFRARDRVYLYANDGKTEAEVFRGYLWSRSYASSPSDREITLVCYDNLIYLQESDDSLYFSPGNSTVDVVSSICNKWGIKLNYSYSSITHSKLPLRGNLYDILTADILDLVKRKTGKKYVVISDQDTMYVKPAGANTTIYKFQAKQNVTKTASGWTMDGVVTQVVIVGKADNDGREPIETTVGGHTSLYGTLQKILNRVESTTLAEAIEEAQHTINEYGAPKNEYEVTAPDVPWIRKGDKVYVNAGDIGNKYLIVVAIDRIFDGTKCEMVLTAKDV